MTTHDDGAASRPSLEPLHKLERDLPRLGDVLQRAHELRQRRMHMRGGGARFRGLDQLLTHLDAQAAAFDQSPPLHRLMFLIRRTAADFETAIETALSGYLAVTTDAMRDVMEIENLLLDFAIDPSHISDWLSADAKTLRTRYAAAEVRRRLHQAGEGRFASSADAPDYRAHSEALHVRPGRHPIADKGFSAESGWDGDAAYWEIFEHARRLLRAIARLTENLAPGTSADTIAHETLPQVDDAWKRTQEMQAIYVATLQGSASTGGSE